VRGPAPRSLPRAIAGHTVALVVTAPCSYGQTGTGKTYTMEGYKNEAGELQMDSPDAGIIVRAVRRVFNALERMPSDSHVKISFLEIYNEVSRCMVHP